MGNEDANTNQNTGTTNTNAGTAFDFTAWLGTQDDATKTGLTGHFERETVGLKGALSKEREGRESLEKQLKAMQKSAEKGSEFEKQLADMANELAQSKRRIAFFSTQPADLADSEAALLIVEAKQLIGEDGKVDWDALRKQHVSLFAKAQQAPPPPNANAANGGRGAGLSKEDLISKKRASGAYGAAL